MGFYDCARCSDEFRFLSQYLNRQLFFPTQEPTASVGEMISRLNPIEKYVLYHSNSLLYHSRNRSSDLEKIGLNCPTLEEFSLDEKWELLVYNARNDLHADPVVDAFVAELGGIPHPTTEVKFALFAKHVNKLQEAQLAQKKWTPLSLFGVKEPEFPLRPQIKAILDSVEPRAG